MIWNVENALELILRRFIIIRLRLMKKGFYI